ALAPYKISLNQGAPGPTESKRPSTSLPHYPFQVDIYASVFENLIVASTTNNAPISPTTMTSPVNDITCPNTSISSPIASLSGSDIFSGSSIICLNISTEYVSGLILTMIFIHAGMPLNGKKAPDKNNIGNNKIWITIWKPCAVFKLAAINNPIAEIVKATRNMTGINFSTIRNVRDTPMNGTKMSIINP